MSVNLSIKNVPDHLADRLRQRADAALREAARLPRVARDDSALEHLRLSAALRRRMLESGELLPTFAELAGAKVPDDIDGLSFVPELLGEKAAGHAQSQHEYLYWSSLEGETAVGARMGDWKLVQYRAKKQRGDKPAAAVDQAGYWYRPVYNGRQRCLNVTVRSSWSPILRQRDHEFRLRHINTQDRMCRLLPAHSFGERVSATSRRPGG